MSESQQIGALHERFIKGINLRMLGCMAVFLLGLGYYANKFQTMLEEDHYAIVQLVSDFKEFKVVADTIKSRQEQYRMSTEYHFKDIDRQLSKTTK